MMKSKQPTIQIANLEGRTFKLGYKVVTDDLKSLGLRNNPNIIQYPIDKWFFLPADSIASGSDDWGGIWTLRLLSGAKRLRDYMYDYHKMETRVFKACLGKILFYNSYRIKTNAIRMFEEL